MNAPRNGRPPCSHRSSYTRAPVPRTPPRARRPPARAEAGADGGRHQAVLRAERGVVGFHRTLLRFVERRVVPWHRTGRSNGALEHHELPCA